MRSVCGLSLALALAILMTAAAAAEGSVMPYASPSGTVAAARAAAGGPAQASKGRTRSDDRTSETWIVFAILVLGLGAVTIRMLRHRRVEQVPMFTFRFPRDSKKADLRAPATPGSGSSLLHQP